jgi:hypothetical protein
MGIKWFIVGVEEESSGVGSLIILALLGGVAFALYRLVQWVAANWQIIVFVIFNVVLVIYIISRLTEHTWSKVKAHGGVFSLFWWLGTIVLLVSVYFVKKYSAAYPDYMKIVFGVVFGIVFLLEGAITGGKEGVKDSAAGWALGFRRGIPILGFIVGLIFAYAYGGIGQYKVLVSIIFGFLSGIGCGIVSIILSLIFGAIGKLCGIGLAISGAFFGVIRGAVLGALFGVFVNALLPSPFGAVAAAEMVLAGSFLFFERFSPVDEGAAGECRKPILALLLFLALTAAVGVNLLNNETLRSGAFDALAQTGFTNNPLVNRTFTLDVQSENGQAKIFEVRYGKDETVISIIRTTGSHKDVSIAELGGENSFYVKDAVSGKTYPLKEARLRDYEDAAGVELVFDSFLSIRFDLVEGNDTSASAWRFTVGEGIPGPGGGYVFYDKGEYSDGWRYLEAAPSSTEFKAAWNAAIRKAGRLKTDGGGNWRLPTMDELDLMHKNLSLKGVGGFSGAYWSSNEGGYNNNAASVLYFWNGEQHEFGKKGNYLVRAVRRF